MLVENEDYVCVPFLGSSGQKEIAMLSDEGVKYLTHLQIKRLVILLYALTLHNNLLCLEVKIIKPMVQ